MFLSRFTIPLVIIGILFQSAFAKAQQLSKPEQQLIAQVSKNNPEAIQFLEEVVNINSGTLHLEGVKEVGDVFTKAFQNIGFDTQWIEMPPEMNRAGHLFATTKGNKGKRLLLIGHLDTVFEKDSEFQQFEMVNDSIAKGPGANDMKGGNVVVLYALKALYESGLLKDSQITIAFTGDEESTGKPLSISRKPLIDAAKQSDIALGFETSTGFDNATVARRGSSNWNVTVTGKRAHSSGIFSEYTGAGANFELARILHQFYTDVKGEELLTFNPGMMLGGTSMDLKAQESKGAIFGKGNVVAQTAYAQGGLRFISEEQKERARAKMREVVANNLPHTSAKVEFQDSYPAMRPTPENYELLEVLSQVSQDLGQPKVEGYDPGKRGAADVSFVAAYVACLDGLGTMGTGAHTPSETVNLNTIEMLTQRTAILIYRLINTPR
ncbi:peptidase M20 [Dokdonia pacifica]|uniref:Glutamate carboxypeptidase n=1 Tax=Dokdonia pacifica TaxID=1627892 RepID=A0A238W908_9FLAO|nr:M20/M25/M40 family metallo-hydrolase [Dokdonia pacifica]GGG13988.1 peptidase M20 [Dokdonia pacifica]SNR43030.1 glutamate carboxypeptidase [Dokdonia pacifica]